MISDSQINKLIGKPWEIKGNGNPGFDCYSLICHLYRSLDIEWPDWEYSHENWQKKARIDFKREVYYYAVSIQQPRSGDFVIFNGGHIGFMIDKFRVLSCDIKRGVSIIKVKWLKDKLTFWRPKKFLEI